MKSAAHLTVLVLGALGGAPALEARAQDASGQALLRFMPAQLAGHPRRDPTPYSGFATSAYQVTPSRIATLQIHDVRGGGAAAHQQRTCTRRRTVGGHEACVSTRRDTTSLIWVFSDSIQVMLGGPDEATVVAMAADLDLDAIAALARSLAGR